MTCKFCEAPLRGTVWLFVETNPQGEEEDDRMEPACDACARKYGYCTCCGHHDSLTGKLDENNGMCEDCIEDEYDAKMQDKAEADNG